MPKPDELALEPRYGWGWTGIPPHPIRETPKPFKVGLVTATPGIWAGIVITRAHEFETMTVNLTQRHIDWDGHVNVSISDGDRLVTEGWAGIADYRLLEGRRVSLGKRLKSAIARYRPR